jgi:hypothetical protein
MRDCRSLEANARDHHYRHPVARALWKLPAGLGDQDGEEPLNAPRRESAEDKGVHAATWRRSAHDLHPSPVSAPRQCGYTSPPTRNFASVSGHGGERDLGQRWLPLEQDLQAVLTGAICNGLAVAGGLAAYASWRDLHNNATG